MCPHRAGVRHAYKILIQRVFPHAVLGLLSLSMYGSAKGRYFCTFAGLVRFVVKVGLAPSQGEVGPQGSLAC